MRRTVGRGHAAANTTERGDIARRHIDDGHIDGGDVAAVHVQRRSVNGYIAKGCVRGGRVVGAARDDAAEEESDGGGAPWSKHLALVSRR